jgi:hypothetical protein
MEKKRGKHSFKTVKTPDDNTVKKWIATRINNGISYVLQK